MNYFKKRELITLIEEQSSVLYTSITDRYDFRHTRLELEIAFFTSVVALIAVTEAKLKSELDKEYKTSIWSHIYKMGSLIIPVHYYERNEFGSFRTDRLSEFTAEILDLLRTPAESSFSITKAKFFSKDLFSYDRFFHPYPDVDAEFDRLLSDFTDSSFKLFTKHL